MPTPKTLLSNKNTESSFPPFPFFKRWNFPEGWVNLQVIKLIQAASGIRISLQKKEATVQSRNNVYFVGRGFYKMIISIWPVSFLNRIVCILSFDLMETNLRKMAAPKGNLDVRKALFASQDHLLRKTGLFMCYWNNRLMSSFLSFEVILQVYKSSR